VEEEDLESSLTILAIIVIGGLALLVPDEAHELHEQAADDAVKEETLLCSLLTSVNNLRTLLLAMSVICVL